MVTVAPQQRLAGEAGNLDVEVLEELAEVIGAALQAARVVVMGQDARQLVLEDRQAAWLQPTIGVPARMSSRSMSSTRRS